MVRRAVFPEARQRRVQVGFEHAKRTYEVLKISRSGDREALRQAVAKLMKYRNSIDHLFTADMAYLQMREEKGSWNQE